MDIAIPGDCALGERRAIGAGRAPLGNQTAKPLEVLWVGIEDRVDVTGGAHDSVADQGDAADQHIADAGPVEVLEDPAEAAHRYERLGAARASAWLLSAIPSASSSSGSRPASRIKR